MQAVRDASKNNGEGKKIHAFYDMINRISLLDDLGRKEKEILSLLDDILCDSDTANKESKALDCY